MTTAHRITNICYPRGSVVYAKFNKNSDYYYLNMRPLIVVSQQTQMFDSLTVIGCGSRDRPGVEISLFNHEKGHWIGNHQFTVAQPYAIFSIIVNQIVEFHGVIDPWTMKAIDKAMAFHLGLTDEVPPYMEDIFNDLLKPNYSLGNDENTQLNDPHQLGSKGETTRKFAKITNNNKSDLGKPYPKKNTQKVALRPNTNTIESVMASKAAKAEKEKIIAADEECTSSSEIKEPEKNQRIGTAVLMVPNFEELESEVNINDTILSIASSLTDDDRVKVITKKMEPGNYGENGNITIWANQISQIRKAIEVIYNLNNFKFACKMADRICHQQRNFRFLSHFEKVAAIMYGSPESLGLSESIYNEVAKQVIKEHHLQFDDGRSWKNFQNFERMKKIYTTFKKSN